MDLTRQAEARARPQMRGESLWPQYDRGSICSLAPTMALSLGLQMRRERALPLDLDPVEHAVLLLVDSMDLPMAGQILELAPRLRERLRAHEVLTSTFPSVTPTGISSILSGLYPGEHGIPGFRFLLEGVEKVVNFYRLSPAEVEDKRGVLLDMKFDPSVFQFDGLFAAAQRAGLESRIVQPREISQSHSTRLLSDHADLHGYRLLDRLTHPLKKGDRGFTYLYVSALDEILHQEGSSTTNFEKTLRLLARALNDWAALRPALRLFMVSDHGHIDTDPGRVVDLQDKELRAMLDHIPAVSGGRVAYLHTQRPNDVTEYLRKKWGDAMDIHPTQQAVDQGLFGPTAYNPRFRGRIGDLTLIARGQTYLQYRYTKENKHGPRGATHSALTRQEMLVPLLVFDL
ncbi:MAG: alkaline phosphatase family protein [Euryarchaeota archaeon]|nr:alkaline phosphatase family protein [Euryarchaeota archaeon]